MSRGQQWQSKIRAFSALGFTNGFHFQEVFVVLKLGFTLTTVYENKSESFVIYVAIIGFFVGLTFAVCGHGFHAGQKTVLGDEFTLGFRLHAIDARSTQDGLFVMDLLHISVFTACQRSVYNPSWVLL